MLSLLSLSCLVVFTVKVTVQHDHRSGLKFIGNQELAALSPPVITCDL